MGVWKYDGKNPEEFLKRNTFDDIEKYKPELYENVKIADKNPLLFGKNIFDFDRIIYGHYHFLGNVILDSLNGTGVAITDKAIYYVLDDDQLIRYKVPYNYEKVYIENEKKNFLIRIRLKK